MPETVHGYLAEHFVREQDAFDTFERIDLYDAVSPVKGTLELEPIQDPSDLNEDSGTASYQGSIINDQGVGWKGTFKVKPKDPADLDIDLHQFNDGAGTVLVEVHDVSDTVNGPHISLDQAALLDAFTANYQILPDIASDAAGDGFLIGHAKQFSRVEFNDLDTGNGQDATWNADGGKYQYSTGEGTWADLTVTDATDITAQDGKRTLQAPGTILFTIPSDWVKATYDVQRAYWIQYIIVTADTLTQPAIIDDTNKDEPFVINVDQMGPDIRAFLRAAMGHEEAVGITSIAYKLLDNLNNLEGLQLTKHLEGYLQENGSGCWVNEFTLSITGNDDPVFEFTGNGARYGRFAKDVVGSGGIATGVAVCPLNDASRGVAREPALCQIGDDSNTSTGYLVTAHDDTAASGDFTISPVLAGSGEAADEAVLPFAPARNESGTILPGTGCSLTIDGVPLGFISAMLKVTTGIQGLNKEATSDRANRLSRGIERVIELEIQAFYLTSATGNAPIAGRAFDKATHDVDYQIGQTSGLRLKVSVPAFESRVSAVEVPEEDLVLVTLKGRAKQSSAAADELVLLFD